MTSNLRANRVMQSVFLSGFIVCAMLSGVACEAGSDRPPAPQELRRFSIPRLDEMCRRVRTEAATVSVVDPRTPLGRAHLLRSVSLLGRAVYEVKRSLPTRLRRGAYKRWLNAMDSVVRNLHREVAVSSRIEGHRLQQLPKSLRLGDRKQFMQLRAHNAKLDAVESRLRLDIIAVHRLGKGLSLPHCVSLFG
jgi:hypothetical protein